MSAYDLDLARLVLDLWTEQAATIGVPAPSAYVDLDDLEEWLSNQTLPRSVFVDAARGDVTALAEVRRVVGLPALR